MNIIGTDVSKAVEIRLGNFPDKWKMEHTQLPNSKVVATPSQQHRPAVGAAGGMQRTWATTQVLPPTPVQSSASERPVLIRQEDVHPTIKTMMEGYIRHFRSVQLRLLCKAAGITEGDLPTDARYVKNGRNGLCYTYILGKCNGKYCNRAQEGHVPAGELSDSFVESLCNLLRPGVEARKATEPPAQEKDFYVGNKRKRTA
jgi:hypothetical protein